MPRRPLTLNDAPRVARFLTEWWIPIDVAQLRRDWERDGFELGRDSWLATDSDRETVAFGCIYPEGWAVAAATTETDYREVVSELRSRAHGGVIRMLESTANGARLAVLREQGFAETAQFTQWRLILDSESIDTSSDITVEQAQGEPDYRKMFNLITNAYGDHLDYDAWLDWITTWKFDPRIWLVVRRNDSVEGALVGWTFPGEGYIKRVAVSEASPDPVAVAGALVRAAIAVFRSDAVVPRVALPVGSGEPPYLTEVATRLGLQPEERVTLLELQQSDSTY